MPKTRLDVAREIAAHIKPTEAALNSTLAEFGSLLVSLARAPGDANLPIHAGQRALEQVVSAAALVTQARGQMALAHTSFAATKRRIGLGETGLGDELDTPPLKITEALPVLTVVACAA